MNKTGLKTTVTATTLLAVAASFGVEARTSTPTEIRGYANCVAAAEAESNGLVPAREYLVSKTDDATVYYVNATRWENGKRSYVRIACETTSQGHELLNASIEQGRFDTPDTRVRVELAQQ